MTFSSLVWLETERPNRQQRLSGRFAVFLTGPFTRSEVFASRVKVPSAGQDVRRRLVRVYLQ